jgi:hypothetical protein
VSLEETEPGLAVAGDVSPKLPRFACTWGKQTNNENPTPSSVTRISAGILEYIKT